MNSNSRNLGLDIVRSMAIVLVLISHSRSFFKDYDLQFLSICGLLGVEIFFVLSGFLIGKIIINSIVENPSINSLGNFYIRRWFRTLPLYYLVLILVSIISERSIPLRNLIFMQNFNESDLDFLAVSWSLSIEEWFYFFIPLIFLICIKLLSKRIDRKKIFFIISIGITIIVFLLRCYMVMRYNPTWDYGVRKQIFLRLDAIMMGVILSGIKRYYNKIYEKLTSTKLSAITSLIGFVSIAYVYIIELDSGRVFDRFIIWKVFLFTIIPLTCMFFISWFETSSFINIKLIKIKLLRIFNFISITSYSIYLIHYNIYSVFSSKAQGIKQLALTIIITLLLAILINTLYEIPIMNLRDKLQHKAKV
jgi:peptidoglycan/LPS O-acetylase OafA/YrhL